MTQFRTYYAVVWQDTVSSHPAYVVDFRNMLGDLIDSERVATVDDVVLAIEDRSQQSGNDIKVTFE